VRNKKFKKIKKTILGYSKKYLKMNSEDEEIYDESDDYDIYKLPKIIKVDDQYEVKNGLLELKRDIILKLTTPMNEEGELKNLFSISKKISTIKTTQVFKRLRYFPPILQIKHGQPVRDDEDYEIRGNRVFVSKEFMIDCVINYKMYKDTGIYRLKDIWYCCTYYSLTIGLIEYVNGIYNFMTDNHYCFYDNGVFENVKLYEYSYRINPGDNVMLELDTNKRILYLFVNNVIQPLCITNLPLPCCFLIVSVGKTDRIEFKSLLHIFDPTYSIDFVDKSKDIKWFYRNY
jgi:hypothetical protein